MEIIHGMEGERVYELSVKLKEKFDECFPFIRGNYPKLVMTVIPLDTEKNQVLPHFSGVLVRYDVRFGQIPTWREKDQVYKVNANVDCSDRIPQVMFWSENIREPILRKDNSAHTIFPANWHWLERELGYDQTKALGEKLKIFSSCSQAEEKLGEIWSPFLKQIDLHTVWIAFLNDHNERAMSFCVEDCGCPYISSIFGNIQISNVTYIYQGILASNKSEKGSPKMLGNALFLLDKEWKPTVKISRSEIVDMPLKLLVAVYGISNKYGMLDTIENCAERISGIQMRMKMLCRNVLFGIK